MAAGEIAIRTAEGSRGQVAAERGLVELCRRGDAQAFARHRRVAQVVEAAVEAVRLAESPAVLHLKLVLVL